jgi:hypothetical protein
LVPCIVEGRSELRNAGRVNCKTFSDHFRSAEHFTFEPPAIALSAMLARLILCQVRAT